MCRKPFGVLCGTMNGLRHMAENQHTQGKAQMFVAIQKSIRHGLRKNAKESDEYISNIVRGTDWYQEHRETADKMNMHTSQYYQLFSAISSLIDALKFRC